MSSEINQPKITVIVPVYNVEKYLRECLDSVINQSLKEIEILCINDCSTDNSMKILWEYSMLDARVRVIDHKQNQGLSIARNTGLSYAKGEGVFFLDSDDLLDGDVLEKLYLAMMSSGADIVMSWGEAFMDVDSSDKTVVAKMTSWLRFPPQSVQKIPITEISSRKIPCVAWGKMFRRHFLEQNKLRFINQRVPHEDAGFWLKCLSFSPLLVSLDVVVVRYRIRGNSTMGKQVFVEDKVSLMECYIDAIQFVRVQLPKEQFAVVSKEINKLLKRLGMPMQIDGEHIVEDKSVSKYGKYRFLSRFALGAMRRKYKEKFVQLERMIALIPQETV